MFIFAYYCLWNRRYRQFQYKRAINVKDRLTRGCSFSNVNVRNVTYPCLTSSRNVCSLCPRINWYLHRIHLLYNITIISFFVGFFIILWRPSFYLLTSTVVCLQLNFFSSFFLSFDLFHLFSHLMRSYFLHFKLKQVR